jgi:hypothetical protein
MGPHSNKIVPVYIPMEQEYGSSVPAGKAGRSMVVEPVGSSITWMSSDGITKAREQENTFFDTNVSWVGIPPRVLVTAGE